MTLRKHIKRARKAIAKLERDLGIEPVATHHGHQYHIGGRVFRVEDDRLLPGEWLVGYAGEPHCAVGHAEAMFRTASALAAELERASLSPTRSRGGSPRSTRSSPIGGWIVGKWSRCRQAVTRCENGFAFFDLRWSTCAAPLVVRLFPLGLSWLLPEVTE